MKYLILREHHRTVIEEDWFSPALLPDGYEKYVKLELDPSTRQWAIQANSYIGNLPLTPEHAIQIRPKSGVKHLTYILNRSGLLNQSLETPFNQTVPYQLPDDDLDSFVEGLIESFLIAVDSIK